MVPGQSQLLLGHVRPLLAAHIGTDWFLEFLITFQGWVFFVFCFVLSLHFYTTNHIFALIIKL